ncbi:hypothetical protein J5N97_015329 [Dioscorea zingiberensis]|uniref:Uncharacterized protein n=1 Tax=Dioscorea zingiberensis TaxID=325984 RepID=A0A9D5CWY9_9LILI|nr:hypothetical protein J5N97_015329 [Dioscorea zingiberensis]
MDCYSSDLESVSEAENDDEDFVGIEDSKHSGLAIDFLKDAVSLPFFKTAFEALAINVSELDCKQDTDLLVALATEEHLETVVRSVGAFLLKDDPATDASLASGSDSEKSVSEHKGKELFKRLHEVGTLAQYSRRSAVIICWSLEHCAPLQVDKDPLTVKVGHLKELVLETDDKTALSG